MLLMSVGAKRVKLSHSQDEFAACDTWLSTAERKNVISITATGRLYLPKATEGCRRLPKAAEG